jgi:U3 small nucleolar ribonucleoprotein protein LCP5
MSFLELKNQLMLSYLQNLTLLMLKKASGSSIENDPATLRLVEIRTVLERMRPIETKLKYHIDKLLKASLNDSKSDEKDPLSFRPNPDQFISKAAETNGSEDEEDDEPVDRKGSDNIYV